MGKRFYGTGKEGSGSLDKRKGKEKGEIKMNNFQYTDEVELWVATILKEWINEQGQTVRKIKWTKQEEPINFGSHVKPQNTEVIAFKYIPKPKPNPIGDMFGNIFGGMK